MSETPWDADPIIAPAKQVTPSAETPWASDPIAPPEPSFDPSDSGQISDHVLKLLNDPKVSGKQIRDFYSSMGTQISDHDSEIFDSRDRYIAAHGETPRIGTEGEYERTGAPALVDNRPLSYWQGVANGGEHVVENAVGGLGWIGNKVGLDNNIGQDTRDYFSEQQGSNRYRGSREGKFVGEVGATLPLAFLTPQIEGASLLAGLGRTAVAATDGAVSAGLTTNSTDQTGVLTDMAIGAGLGVGMSKSARALGNLAGTPTRAAQEGREVIDAADRLSRDGLAVKPLPGDTGGALSRGSSAVAESGIISNIPYSRGVEDYMASTQSVRDRAAMAINGGVAPKEIDHVAGEVQNAVGGLGDYEARSAQTIGKQYDDAAALAQGVEIQTPATLNALDRIIARAENTPGGSPGLPALKSLRDDLTPSADTVVRPSSWARELGAQDEVIAGNKAAYAIDNLRRLRTAFGDNFDVNQRAAREAARELWAPLSEDIQHGLRNAGHHDAADAYQAADTAWAQRQTNLDEVVTPILGSRNQGQLADHLVALSQDDFGHLNRALDLMSPPQASQVRAAIVGNLGRAKAGQQTADNGAFSLQGFLTDWSKLADDTKNMMLSGQAGSDLQDLARLAQGARQAGRYKNTSGTARSADALSLIKSLGSTVSGPGGGFAVGGLPGLLAGGAAQYGLGRAMASPTLAKALVRAGEIRPIARGAQGLSKIGKFVAPIVANGVDDDPQ